MLPSRTFISRRRHIRLPVGAVLCGHQDFAQLPHRLLECCLRLVLTQASDSVGSLFPLDFCNLTTALQTLESLKECLALKLIKSRGEVCCFGTRNVAPTWHTHAHSTTQARVVSQAINGLDHGICLFEHSRQRLSCLDRRFRRPITHATAPRLSSSHRRLRLYRTFAKSRCRHVKRHLPCSALTVWNVHQGIGSRSTFTCSGNRRLISGLNVAISGHREGLNRPIIAHAHLHAILSGLIQERRRDQLVARFGRKMREIPLFVCQLVVVRRSLEIALRPHGLVCHHGALRIPREQKRHLRLAAQPCSKGLRRCAKAKLRHVPLLLQPLKFCVLIWQLIQSVAGVELLQCLS